MKRIFTLLLLSTIFYQVKAQILFSQDFESGTLAPMTAVDVDGVPVNPGAPSFCGLTWTVVGSSNKLVVSTSWINPVGVVDDWLISPPISITEANTFLFWDAFAQDPAFRDGYEVRVSTTDNQVASFTDLILNIPAELTTYQRRLLRLDAYIGDTIYFAFRNHSNDQFLLYMDNISVQVLKDEDIVIKGITLEKYSPVGTNTPVKVSIENKGINPLTSFNFSWSDGNNVFTDTIVGLNILTRGTQEFTHSSLYPAEAIPGESTVNILLDNPNQTSEGNPYDNVRSRYVYSLDEQLPKKVVVEEGTGTWCGYCPYGFVTMERIAEEYADVAIPIAVHNQDPMAFIAYDSPFSQSVSGYPSGHIDRKEVDIHPNHPQTGYGFVNGLENLKGRMVPVRVDIETTFDSDTRIVHIKGTGSASIPTQANNLRFSAVLTEDNVTGTSIGYNQVNYFVNGQLGVMGGFESLPNPVPASQMVYNFTARALLGGFNGLENSIPDTLEANEDFEVEFSYQIPIGYDENEMKAIIFILDDETGEILNGATTRIVESTSVPLIPQGSTLLYPNPANDILNLEVNFQTTGPVSMIIYDTYGRLIRNLGTIDLSNGIKLESINISELHAGSYLLELRHQNSVTALPFTKI